MADARITFDITVSAQRPPMPLDTLVAHTVQDSAERMDGPDEFSGTGGGDLDVDSGVLTLSFTPFTGQETEGDPQEYAETTVRFIEVEKLLDALCKGIVLGSDLAPSSEARDYWRLVLAEKLDALKL
jgi:hypothetical protein